MKVIQYKADHPWCIPQRNGEMYDLAVSEEVLILKGQSKIISLGIRMRPPEGYYIKVYPRSSTYKKWHITMTNSVGIIEHNYCGNDDVISFCARADETARIPAGTRIAQFELCKCQPDYHFEELEDMGCENRGGFGSTGE